MSNSAVLGLRVISLLRPFLLGLASVFVSSTLSAATVRAQAATAPGQTSSNPVANAQAPRSSLTFVRGATSSGWQPFEFYAGKRIFVRVEVNGESELAMLDSGASETVLDKRFAARLGLVSGAEQTGQGAGGSTKYGELQGVDLKLGKLRWKGGTAVAIDLAAVERQIGHALPIILGGEIFNGSVVEIDFQARRIAFHEPVAYVSQMGAKVLRLTRSGESRAINVMVEGRPATLLFDLGNASTVDLFPRFWESPQFNQSRLTSSALAGGVGGMSIQKVTSIKSLAIGGATFVDLPGRLENRQFSQDAASGLLDGNLGMGILSRFRLIVDFPHDRVLFASPVDETTPFEVNHSGLTLQPNLTESRVLHVATASPAALAGIHVGDIIRTVDGKSVADLSTGNGWENGQVGSIVRLGLADGTTKAVTLARYY